MEAEAVFQSRQHLWKRLQSKPEALPKRLADLPRSSEWWGASRRRTPTSLMALGGAAAVRRLFPSQAEGPGGRWPGLEWGLGAG